MSGTRIFQPAYRMLIDELADAGTTEPDLTVQQQAVVLRQYSEIMWDVFGDDDLHKVSDAMQVSAEACAREVSRIVVEAIARLAQHYVREDVTQEIEKRDLEDDVPDHRRHHSGLPSQGEI